VLATRNPQRRMDISQNFVCAQTVHQSLNTGTQRF
jgi:hypothetical protein